MTDYIVHPNQAYRGNPPIEALGYPPTKSRFEEDCKKPANVSLDLSNTPEEYHGYAQRTALDMISQCHVVQDEAYRLLDSMLRMISLGYLKRNPIGPAIGATLLAIEADKKNEDIYASDSTLAGLDLGGLNHCMFLAGLSGRGKSSMIAAILAFIPDRIIHTTYLDPNGKKHHLNQIQIPHIYVQIGDRRGEKALLQDILSVIASRTDNPSYMKGTKGATVNELTVKVRKAAIIHSVGIIVVDEAQNLAANGSQKSSDVTVRFLEFLFNRIGVPLFLIGTHGMLPQLSAEMKSIRRMGESGSRILGACDVESSFWKRFIREICQIQILGNQQTDLDTLRYFIHDLTAGIPAVAATLVRLSLSFLTFFPKEDQDLSADILTKIRDEEMAMIIPAVNALKKKDYKSFKDYNELAGLEEIEQLDVDAALNRLESKYCDSSSDNQQPMVGDLGQKQPTEEKIEDTPKAQKVFAAMKTNTLLGSLGHDIGETEVK